MENDRDKNNSTEEVFGEELEFKSKHLSSEIEVETGTNVDVFDNIDDDKIVVNQKENEEPRTSESDEIEIDENEEYDKKIVIVGSGAFGTAIAESLVRDKTKKNKIVLFGINSKEINDINKNHRNSKYFSIKLSAKLHATTNSKKAFNDADIILLAVPSMAIRTSLKESIIPNLNKPAYFINLSKGFDYLNVDILSNVIKKTVPEKFNNGVLKLAGASFATEVINKQPTSFVLAADNKSISEEIYSDLSNSTMKIIPMDSLDAIEWISIIKNPLALLQGIVAGLEYQVNTRSIFFAQAANEMKRLLQFLNLNENVIFSPAGIGDLYLTGSSRKSRNYATGFAIGKADRVTKKILQRFTTVEGLRSIEILLRLSRRNKLDLKSIEILYSITYDKNPPSKVIQNYLDKF